MAVLVSSSACRTLRYSDPEELRTVTREAEIELLQASRGGLEGATTRFSAREVAMQHTVLSTSTILRGAASPSSIVLFLPLRWEGEYKLNGVTIEQPRLLSIEDEFVRSATNLDTLSFALPREPVEAAALALAGLAEKKREIGTAAIQGPPTELAALEAQMVRLARLTRLHPEALDVTECREALERQLLTEAVGLFAKLYESPSSTTRIDTGKHEVVRRAEERFETAPEKPVSLADLCLAAGVSARALQYAFRDLYGVSPIRYFRLRRLHEAHRSLRTALPERSAVKRAALGAGLTDLGRFSVEYRALFGQSPSATLTEH
jgi:AraC-like DNA-binding protein